MKLAHDNMRRGMRMMPLLAAVCAVIHMRWAPAEAVIAWLLIFLPFCVLRMWVERALPADASDPKAVRRGAKAYFASSLLFVLAWGSQAVLFWEAGNATNQLSITIIMVASAMSAALIVSWAPAAVTQLTIYLGSVAILLLSQGTPTGTMLAGATVLYTIFLATGLGSLHGAARRMLCLEDEKDVLISELRASNQAKSEFLANMSHELRTPLNAILGFSEVMRGEMFGTLGSVKYRDYAGDIHTSGAHLLSLINDILDVAKIEAGRFVPSDDCVTVRRVANEAVRLVSLRAEEAGVTLQLSVEGHPRVRGDERALKQSIINLLSNALKFTPRGGTVTLGARRTAFGATLIWVSDTGCGISAEDQAKLFQNFGQGRHDVAVKERGTGLGLVIVKGIVEAHGGTVGLDSALGRGTTVTVTLPASRALRPVAEAA